MFLIAQDLEFKAHEKKLKKQDGFLKRVVPPRISAVLSSNWVLHSHGLNQVQDPLFANTTRPCRERLLTLKSSSLTAC